MDFFERCTARHDHLHGSGIFWRSCFCQIPVALSGNFPKTHSVAHLFPSSRAGVSVADVVQRSWNYPNLENGRRSASRLDFPNRDFDHCDSCL